MRSSAYPRLGHALGLVIAVGFAGVLRCEASLIEVTSSYLKVSAGWNVPQGFGYPVTPASMSSESSIFPATLSVAAQLGGAANVNPSAYALARATATLSGSDSAVTFSASTAVDSGGWQGLYSQIENPVLVTGEAFAQFEVNFRLQERAQLSWSNSWVNDYPISSSSTFPFFYLYSENDNSVEGFTTMLAVTNQYLRDLEAGNYRFYGTSRIEGVADALTGDGVNTSTTLSFTSIENPPAVPDSASPAWLLGLALLAIGDLRCRRRGQ